MSGSPLLEYPIPMDLTPSLISIAFFVPFCYGLDKAMSIIIGALTFTKVNHPEVGNVGVPEALVASYFFLILQ